MRDRAGTGAERRLGRFLPGDLCAQASFLRDMADASLVAASSPALSCSAISGVFFSKKMHRLDFPGCPLDRVCHSLDHSHIERLRQDVAGLELVRRY
jgi:hypothetical protein